MTFNTAARQATSDPADPIISAGPAKLREAAGYEARPFAIREAKMPAKGS